MDRTLPGVGECLFNGPQDTDKSRPGSRANDVPGLTDQKDTDRLMDIMHERTDSAPPRPAICPICGLTADNGVYARSTSQPTATATYCDTNDHLWSVTWLVA